MKKRVPIGTILFAVISCVMGCLFVCGAYYIWNYIPPSPHHGIPWIELHQNVTNDSWELTVVNIIWGDEQYNKRCYSDTWTWYRLFNDTSCHQTIFRGNLSDIRNKPCAEYNIMWLDKDENYMVSIGDEFIISKSGGNIGKVNYGWTLMVGTADIGCELGRAVLQ